MIHYDPNTLQFARQNRRQRNATRQEGVLWHCFLKKEKVRFFRQYRIGAYIVDFYCPKRKLAIELDGGQHYEEEALQYDRARTAFLNDCRIKVLRFTNDDVDNNLRGVVTIIKIAIDSK